MPLCPDTFYRPQAPEMREVAAVQTLARWRHEGTGPRYCRSGALVRYKGADVLAWLEARRVETDTAA